MILDVPANRAIVHRLVQLFLARAHRDAHRLLHQRELVFEGVGGYALGDLRCQVVLLGFCRL